MDTVLILVSFISATTAFGYFQAEQLRPCPHVLPVTNLSIDKLHGRWHLSLVVLNSETENLEESDVCITGQINIHNATFMKQTWEMYSPMNGEEPVGNIEFAISVIRPGVWTVQTPLGAQLAATVFGYVDGCLLVAHCGWHKGSLVHLWTAGASRGPVLTPDLRIRLSQLLLDNGYDPTTSEIITWNTDC